MASRMCSAETYSSLNFSASSKAASSTLLAASLEKLLRDAADFWQAVDLLVDFARKDFRPHAQTARARQHDSVLLRHERAKKVQRLKLLLAALLGDILRGLQRFLGFYG